MEALRPHDPVTLGDYRLLGRLGSGGQGTVYLAERADGTRVAVKTLNPEGMADPEVRRRFKGEAEAARRVASFCTAAVLHADFDSEPAHIVSEYVEGPTLHRTVVDDGPLDGGDLMRLSVATATALVSVHEAGIVHRDLKPGNVLMAPGGPRVIDFGISQITEGAGTLTHSTIGTPGFMSPEQIADGRVTAATDVFAWGAVMVFAATGKAPFDAATVPGVLHKVLHVEPDLSGLPEYLRPLVAQALAKTPADRPAAIDVLHRLLGRAPEPRPGPAPTRVLDEPEPAPGPGFSEAPTVPDTPAVPRTPAAQRTPPRPNPSDTPTRVLPSRPPHLPAGSPDRRPTRRPVERPTNTAKGVHTPPVSPSSVWTLIVIVALALILGAVMNQI